MVDSCSTRASCNILIKCGWCNSRCHRAVTPGGRVVEVVVTIIRRALLTCTQLPDRLSPNYHHISQSCPSRRMMKQVEYVRTLLTAQLTPAAFYHDKSTVIQEARVFNESPISPRKCRALLTRIVYLLYTGETFSTQEATTLFFGVTKLFQHKDVGALRLSLSIEQPTDPVG